MSVRQIPKQANNLLGNNFILTLLKIQIFRNKIFGKYPIEESHLFPENMCFQNDHCAGVRKPFLWVMHLEIGQKPNPSIHLINTVKSVETV